MAKIKEFSFKNVRSYGNKLTTIPFDMENGLVLIVGENGFGKTSICEALEYGIYGKSSRVQSKNLPNWINDNMYTHVTFETDDNRTIKLARGISPDFYQLTVDDNTNIDSKVKKSESVSSKARLDKLVEDELFGIPFDVFSNNILLSIHDFKSFINMKAGDKRKIIDKIFDTDIFNQMLKTVKEELKCMKDTAMSIKAEIDAKEKTYESTMERIDELKSQLNSSQDSLIDSLQNEADKLSTMISAKNAEKNQCVSEHISYVNQYNDIIKKLNESKQYITDQYHAALASIDDNFNARMRNETKNIDDEFEKKFNEAKDSYDSRIASLVKPEDGIQELITAANAKKVEQTNIFNTSSENIKNELNEKVKSIDSKHQTTINNTSAYYQKLIDEKNLEIKTFTDSAISHNNTVDELNSSLTIILMNINSLTEKIKLYDNDKCPTCGSDLEHDTFHIEQKNKFINQLDVNNSEKSSIEENITKEKDWVDFFTKKVDNSKNELNALSQTLSSEISSENSKYAQEINDAKNETSINLSKLENSYNLTIDKLNSIIDSAMKTETARYDKEKSEIDSEYNALQMSIMNKRNDEIKMIEYNIKPQYTEDKNKLYENYNNKSAEIANKLAEYENTYNSSKLIYDGKIGSIDLSLNEYNKQYSAVCAQLTSLKNSDTMSIINELSGIASTIECELSQLKSEYDTLNENISVREDTSYIIGDDGVKKTIMRRILPSFNATIDKITTLFDFKYRFLFDDEFNCHMSFCGQPVPISTSRGEEKIMDIIVLLSTLQLILMKHPTVNMLFLDEIFSNLDVKNIARAVSILKDYAKEYNLTIFVMSHTTVPQEMFDEIINVKNDGTFSELEIIK